MPKKNLLGWFLKLIVVELEDCGGMDVFTSSQTSIMPLENYSMLGKNSYSITAQAYRYQLL